MGWLGLVLIGAAGCADQQYFGGTFNPDREAMESARAEAVLNYSCPKMVADPNPGRVQEGDDQQGLFSEYLVKVRGCGVTAVYRVSCRRGGLCEVEE